MRHSYLCNDARNSIIANANSYELRYKLRGVSSVRHMPSEKGSYKRDEREVGKGCNVYVKEVDGRLKGSFRMGKSIAEKLYCA